MLLERGISHTKLLLLGSLLVYVLWQD
jgi:hypothetical protein